jgi:hypothetical protein
MLLLWSFSPFSSFSEKLLFRVSKANFLDPVYFTFCISIFSVRKTS